MLLFFVLLVNILALATGIFLLLSNYCKLTATLLIIQIHIGTVCIYLVPSDSFPFGGLYYLIAIIAAIWFDKKAYFYHMLEMEAAKKEMEEYYANMTPEERTTEFMNDWTMQLAEMRRKQNRKWYQFW